MWEKISADIFTKCAAYWLQLPSGDVVYGIPAVIRLGDIRGFNTLEKGFVAENAVTGIRPVGMPNHETGETESETKIKAVNTWCESWLFENTEDLPENYQVMNGAAVQIKEILQ